MYQLKKFFITTKQALIKDVIKEWNMEWLAEEAGIRQSKGIYAFI